MGPDPFSGSFFPDTAGAGNPSFQGNPSMPIEPLVKDRLVFLDVARGCAALLVVMEHGLEQCVPGYLEWSLPRINLGQIGVLLFFLISGFIIPASLQQGGSQVRFWLRRFFRLFPLYWTSIALSCLFITWSGRPLGGVPLDRPATWLLNVTMLQGFLGQPHVLGVFWTLHLELVIYAACSLLFALGLLSRPALLAWVVLALYVVEGVFLRPLIVGKPFLIGGRMFFYLAPFIGAAFERFNSGALARGSLLRLLGGIFLGVSTICAVNTLMFPQEHGTHPRVWRLLGNWLIAYGGFGLLLAARTWFKPRPLAWMGQVSYSMYLLHLMVLALLMPTRWPAWLFLPALTGATLAVSAASFKWVENPGIVLGRALEWRWLPRRAPAVAMVEGRAAAA
jgi:peptidoglycan/LPS O-acetylase OafA/YrhL